MRCAFLVAWREYAENARNMESGGFVRRRYHVGGGDRGLDVLDQW